MKKYYFYFLIVLLNFIFIEILSFYVVENIKSNYLNKNKFTEKTYQLKNQIIRSEYKNQIPYLRDENQYDGKIYIKLNKKNDFFFNKINSFNNKNYENILIQGDSWGESMNMVDIHKLYSKEFLNRKIGLINSSISSYSLTPYISQLDILYKQFLLKPNILVLIYDQTDIGDDLYRYNFYLSESQYKKFLKYEKKIQEILNEKRFNSLQFVIFCKYYFLKQKSKYQYTNIQTLKYVIRRFYLSKFQKIPIALTPLKYGINTVEENTLKTLLNNYIEIAFSNKKLDKLYFVIHPHYNHLNKNYLFDNRQILKKTIEHSPFKNKINVINFFNKKTNFYKFEKNDLFSHPTKEYYKKIFWPKIFEVILN